MKRSIFLSLAILCHFLLAAQNIPPEYLPPDMGKIISKKEIVIAMTATDQFPFYYLDKSGNLQGFDVDIAKKMAKELGVKKIVINREAQSFNEVVTLVAEGKADLAISKLSRTLARAR